MADIYEHWHQHMASAAANVPGADEAWEVGLPRLPPPAEEVLTPDGVVAWLSPLVVGLLRATAELAREVDRLRDEVDELQKTR